MRTIPKDSIPEAGGRPNGWEYGRISKAEYRRTAKGDDSYNIAWEREDGSFLGYDTIMLSGGGLGIGVSKIQGIGVLEDLGDEVGIPEPHEMLGARAWSFWSDETYNGKTYARVNIQHGKGGYSQDEPADELDTATSGPAAQYGGGVPSGDDPPPFDDDDIPF